MQVPQYVAQYREYAPCPSLRGLVSAYFSFGPPLDEESARWPVTREVLFEKDESFCSPLFADGHISIVLSFEQACACGGRWHIASSRPRGDVIGAMSSVGDASLGERSEMMGVYFRAGHAPAFTGMPANELTDQVVPLEDVWGHPSASMAARLCSMNTAETRIDLLEQTLLARLGRARAHDNTLDVPGLANYVLRSGGRLPVERLADAAGISRQHLARVFRERVGVPPKLFSRLARFQAGLAYAGCEKKVDWAQTSLELGYADQSHMIAEFREFSSLTPEMLASRRWFHPFIERARAAAPLRNAP